MALAPYIPSPEKWKNYFVNIAKSGSSHAPYGIKQRQNRVGVNYYTPLQRGGEKPSLTFISPASQAVNQAKSELRRLRDDGPVILPMKQGIKKRTATSRLSSKGRHKRVHKKKVVKRNSRTQKRRKAPVKRKTVKRKTVKRKTPVKRRGKALKNPKDILGF